MVWDEENRLRGINDNGRLHLYTYDHTGERALKSSAESSMAVINGATSAIITHTEDYTAYISPYFVVQKGKFTKHYFEGSSRVVSKLGEGTFSHKNTGIMAGGLDYLHQTAEQQRIRDKYIKGLQVPPGPPTQHGIYTTPEWTGEAYPSVDWQSISQNQEPPQGWPRPPKFNEPGDVPGSPVQFGPPVTNANVKAGYGYINNGVEEKNLYFYHPDHLGSSSYITDKDGQVIQHTEYMAFGEILVDEHSVSKTMPYLFNGKELDFETGLYYYGARYYDPKVSIFLNVDPLVEKTGTPYAYTYNNPINLIDPTGMEAEDVDDVIITGNKSKEALQQLQLSVKGELQLSIDDEGKVTATKLLDNNLSKGANDLLLATIDRSVIVNISASDNDFTSDNSAPLLGSFMGNEFINYPLISTKQELNTDALTNLDRINGVPGISILHEVTESYIGGKLSQSMKTSVGRASSEDSNNPNSIYRMAHDRVIKQGGDIYENFYNSDNRQIYRQPDGSVPGAVKLIYTTIGNTPFHTVPKQK